MTELTDASNEKDEAHVRSPPHSIHIHTHRAAELLYSPLDPRN